MYAIKNHIKLDHVEPIIIQELMYNEILLTLALPII